MIVGRRGSALPLVLVAARAVRRVGVLRRSGHRLRGEGALRERALDAARAARMDASFALVAKNAGRSAEWWPIMSSATRARCGSGGEGVVWFYETPEESVSSTERHWVVGMQFEEESPTVFARGYGIGRLPVAAVPGADGDAPCRGKGGGWKRGAGTIRLPGGSDCGLTDVRGAELA